MALFQVFADLKGVRHELRRIADALDRAFPVPPQPVPVTEEDVSYSDDEKLALEEAREEARRLGILEDDEEEASTPHA